MSRIVPSLSAYGETWFDIWDADKKGIIAVMYSNMASDLNCGYDPMGKSIREQKEMIRDYETAYENALDSFKTMTDEQINRWCYFDLKKRGAIS